MGTVVIRWATAVFWVHVRVRVGEAAGNDAGDAALEPGG